MNNAVFRKTMENVRKYRDIKLRDIKKEGTIWYENPNYYTTKKISENLLTIEIRKTKILMKKTVYLDLTILKLD